MKFFSVFLVAVFSLSFSVSVFSQSRRRGSAKPRSTMTNVCKTCLNNFSPETLKFTVNADRCPSSLAKCITLNKTSQCEPIINECFAANCSGSGSCGNEMANRAIASGCLKAEDITLPYQCASHISGMSATLAGSVRSQQDAVERQYEMQLKQQDAQIEAEKAAAEKASADASVRVAQEAAAAQAKTAQIAADAKLAEQRQAAQLEQNAKNAEIARQKKEADDIRNNRPDVRYNNIISKLKKDVASAKSASSKAYNLLGIQKTEKKSGGNLFNFAPDPVSISKINVASGSRRAQSLVRGSNYEEQASFICTRDVKESYVKNELNKVYNILKTSGDDISDAIAELEAANLDISSGVVVSEDKIDDLYAMQAALLDTVDLIGVEIPTLNTSCETRCAGMPSFSMDSGGGGATQYDKDGLIIVNSAGAEGDYACVDFNNSDELDMSAMLMGEQQDFSSMMGGVGKKVMDLTKRVTRAVVETDRNIEELEISMLTGEYDSGSSEYETINTCSIALDNMLYLECVKNIVSTQFAVYVENTGSTAVQEALAESLTTGKSLLTGMYGSQEFCKTVDNECSKIGVDVGDDLDTVRANAVKLIARLNDAINFEKSGGSSAAGGGSGAAGVFITNIALDGTVGYSYRGATGFASIEDILKAHCFVFSQKNFSWKVGTTPNAFGVSVPDRIVFNIGGVLKNNTPLSTLCTE